MTARAIARPVGVGLVGVRLVGVLLVGVLLVATGLPVAALGAQDVDRASAPVGVGFSATIGPDTVYVGQQATYQLTVSIPADVRQRLRRNPEFVPPETRSMLAYDLPVPRLGPRGEGAEVHVFRRALFPLTPGRYSIPAARLTLALPQSPSFFSREETRSLRSQSVTLVAVEPPTRGRPSAWGGAVGRWRARTTVDAAVARVGDPFVLTLRVEGVGNASLLPRPAIDISWANVVAEDERVVLDSTPSTLGGSKDFTWLVTPRTVGTLWIPSLSYVFFDPIARQYARARTARLSVRVTPGDLVTIPERAEAARERSALAVRPQLGGAARVALPAAPLWAWLALLAPLPWMFARWRARHPRAPRARSPEDRLRDPDVTSPGAVRALFGAALRRRTGIALEAATDAGALSSALRREGVTPEVATEAERLRDQLDAHAYTTRATTTDWRERTRALLERIDAEARRQGRVGALLVAIMLGACVAEPLNGETALIAFTEGQTAYAGADYARARDAYLRAANAAPRNASAWANFGTAAWQAADTAAAVLGWQRALRLDPMADGLRARLARVRAPQMIGAARVWALPTLPPAAGALVLWCLGWAWCARRRWTHQSARRASLLIVPAVALGVLAWFAEWQSRARDLVVIASSAPLRALPALGADPGAVPLIGEVVRVRERRGVWLRIELDAGRSGWYPDERTYPLARQ